MNYIMRIIETNVDGCGTDCEVFARFPREPSEQELQVLNNALQDIKAGMDFESTEDLIVQSLERLSHQTGLTGEVIPEPFSFTLSF